MHKNPKIWTRLARIVAGICAFSFLLFAINIEGSSSIFGIQKAFAEHPTNCAWYNVMCWIEAYAYHIAFPFIFSLAWIIVAILWAVLFAVRLFWWVVYELIVGAAGLGIMLSTQIIESAVHPGSAIAQGLLYNRSLLDNIHDKLWIPVRDLVHVGFALLLIAGAIITIVKASKDVIAQYGPKFMIAIILVNFSWFIPRVVLDLANVSAVAAFSLARCDNCYVIETFDIQRPPLSCTEAQIGNTSSRRTCPTLFWTATETPVPDVANPARKAIGALLDPFRDLLRLNVLPRTGSNWARLNKLLLVYNRRNTESDGETPPNPGYPSGWIGIGNIIQCIWITCDGTTDPIPGKINTIPKFLDATSGLLVGALLGLFRMVILVFLSAILLVLYLFALIAIMAMVLLRIPIIWLTMGFMPVVALAFVMGRGGFGGFLWGVWDKFVGAAFIPAAIGIPIAAGSAILNAGRNIPNPFNATGIVAEILGPDGVMQIMFMIIAIIVIWMGVFAAISAINFAGAAQQAIAGRVRTLGQGAAMATGYAIAAKTPILPVGKFDRVFGGAVGGLTASTGWLAQKLGAKKTGEKLRQQGGEIIRAGGVGYVWEKGKQWKEELGKTKTGQIIGSTRKAIGSLFSGSALQKILVGAAVGAGTGRFDTVLREYGRGEGSLKDLINKRLRPQMSKDDAKGAAKKLDKDRTKCDTFLKAARAMENDPKNQAARDKLIEVIEELRKDGINVDTSKGLPNAVKTIIEAIREDNTHSRQRDFHSLNATLIENNLIQAEQHTAPPPSPPPSSGTP